MLSGGMNGNITLIQLSNNCNLLRVTTAEIFRYLPTCAIASWEGFGRNLPVTQSQSPGLEPQPNPDSVS